MVATSSLLYRLYQGAPSSDSQMKLQKAKTGRRYMKKYREKFIQYFPTILIELVEKELLNPGLKHNAEHLKEVSATAISELIINIVF